ncbi:hypothetical protein FGO68_gene15349 [Halteria grandinella]|uniref:Uncharacterized protein n=1 Tax=Halteria grandinella TaxID=5974 RepID=A0A8J8NXT2_HALGN|nr:hypothetical protein FGO68_gene15349 [Halteria grandinella]
MRDRLGLKRNTSPFSSVCTIALLCTALALHNTHAHTTAPTQRGCSRMMSGGALLSEREYSVGEFEFKLLPSLSPGIVTVVGLANDGSKHADPYIQIVTEADRYGMDTLAVQMGGVSGLEEINYTYNMSNANFSSGNTLNSTAFYYKWLRAFNDSSNFIELYMSEDHSTYVKVFSTVDLDQSTDGTSVSQFLSAFPLRFNIHAAAWYSNTQQSDNEHMAHSASFPPQHSELSYFKYTDAAGNVEEEFTLESEGPEYLMPQTIGNSMPTWASDNMYTQLMSSNVEYVRAVSDPQTPGMIKLTVNYGILSKTPSSYYLAYDHEDENLSITQQNDDTLITVPLSHVLADEGQMLLSTLDVTPTSATYTFALCAKIESQSNPGIVEEWPVNISIVQLNSEPYSSISTVQGLNFTNINKCYQVTLNVTIASGTRLDMQSGYAALVLDFSPLVQSTSLNALPSDIQATLSKLTLATTQCLNEEAFRFPGQLTDEEMVPEVVYVDKVQYKETVEDEEEKQEYTTAAVVWSIFFVILLLLVPATCYMFLKTRKQVGVENEDLKKLEERVAIKRGKLGENQLLIEKNTPTPTPTPKPQATQMKTPMNGPTPTPNKDLSPYSDATNTHINNKSSVTGGFTSHHQRDFSAIKLQGVGNQSLMVNPIVPDQSLNNSGQTNSRHDHTQRPLDISRKSGYTPQERIDEEDSDGIKSIRHSKHSSEDEQAQDFARRQPYRPGQQQNSAGKDLESPDTQHHQDSLLGKGNFVTVKNAVASAEALAPQNQVEEDEYEEY